MPFLARSKGILARATALDQWVLVLIRSSSIAWLTLEVTQRLSTHEMKDCATAQRFVDNNELVSLWMRAFVTRTSREHRLSCDLSTIECFCSLHMPQMSVANDGYWDALFLESGRGRYRIAGNQINMSCLKLSGSILSIIYWGRQVGHPTFHCWILVLRPKTDSVCEISMDVRASADSKVDPLRTRRNSCPSQTNFFRQKAKFSNILPEMTDFCPEWQVFQKPGDCFSAVLKSPSPPHTTMSAPPKWGGGVAEALHVLCFRPPKPSDKRSK